MPMSERIDYPSCGATIDLGERGIHLCYLHAGHTGSHRHSELAIALAEQRELQPHPAMKWDGNLSGGQWVPLRLYRELQAQRDELAAWRDYAVASCAKRGCSLMEATIREQKDVNDSLAFQLGGVKGELRYVRRLLRRIWSSPTTRDDEPFAQDVVAYLASLPATEEES